MYDSVFPEIGIERRMITSSIYPQSLRYEMNKKIPGVHGKRRIRMKKNEASKGWLKRGVSVTLSAAMIFGMSSVSAFAATGDEKAADVPDTDRKVVYLNAPVEDGVYRGTVNMKMASDPTRYSMGNSALARQL